MHAKFIEVSQIWSFNICTIFIWYISLETDIDSLYSVLGVTWDHIKTISLLRLHQSDTTSIKVWLCTESLRHCTKSFTESVTVLILFHIVRKYFDFLQELRRWGTCVYPLSVFESSDIFLIIILILFTICQPIFF